MIPTTRYARSGNASIAYQVAGEGALDLLFLTGWVQQIEQLWEAPAVRRFLERGIEGLYDQPGRGRRPVFSPRGRPAFGQGRV